MDMPEVPFDLMVEVEERPAPPLSEDPADRRGAHAAHTDQADPQLRLLTATPAIRGRARGRRYRGIGETADSQDSGGYTEELAYTLPRRIPMALLLGDLPGIQQVELDASGDVDDAGLAGFARREVAGLLALARADPAGRSRTKEADMRIFSKKAAIARSSRSGGSHDRAGRGEETAFKATAFETSQWLPSQKPDSTWASSRSASM